MGYLDNGQITVDAILTKKGRELISKGQPLHINAFTLGDAGVDYTLWNPDHPSGSAFYGEAIENLPMLEANVASQYALKDKLVTLNRETIAMPVLEISPDPRTTFVFDTRTPKTFTATIVGYSGGKGSGCQLLVRDSAVVQSNGTSMDITGAALSLLPEQDIPMARLYEMSGGGPMWSFTLTPGLIRNSLNANTNITFIHGDTGAYQSMNIEVVFNQDIRQTITAASTKG